MKQETLILVLIILTFSFVDAKQILVGLGLTSEGLTEGFEIINLDGNADECENLADFPSATYGVIGSLNAAANEVVLCGGAGAGGLEITSECFSLTPNGSWIESGCLDDPRAFGAAASVMESDDIQGIIISGGKASHTDPVPLKSVARLTSSSGRWTSTSLPELAMGVYFHCMVAINEKNVMVIGGASVDEDGLSISSDQTFILDLDSKTWTEGPRLKAGRYHHSCAKIQASSQSDERVIVVGGVNSSATLLDSVEIFDPSLNEWIEGPPLVESVHRSALVEDGEGGVVLVGGRGQENQFVGDLYRLDNAEASWVRMEQRLKRPRQFPVAFLVPDDSNLLKCKQPILSDDVIEETTTSDV